MIDHNHKRQNVINDIQMLFNDNYGKKKEKSFRIILAFHCLPYLEEKRARSEESYDHVVTRRDAEMQTHA